MSGEINCSKAMVVILPTLGLVWKKKVASISLSIKNSYSETSEESSASVVKAALVSESEEINIHH